MNDRDRNRYEALKRVAKFKTDNTALFPTGPAPVDVKATALFATVLTTNTNIAAALEGRATATAGFHAGTTSETTQRDGLLLELLEYNRAAAAIAEADGTPDLMEHFRMPHGVEDSVLAAKARAIKTKAASMSTRFIELGFPNDFAAQLETRIAAFEAAGAGQDSSLAQQAGHTASFGALLKPGLKAVKQLDVICRQKFRTNAQKLGEWLTASHIERLAQGTGQGDGGGEPLPEPPGPPQNPGLTPGATGSGELGAQCEVPEGATGLKIWRVIAGNPPTLLATITDVTALPHVLTFDPGENVEIQFTATNAGGESEPSVSVSATAP